MFSMYIYQCIRISSIVLGTFWDGMEGRGGGRRGLWLDILVKIFFPLGRFNFLAFLHARPAEHLTNPNPFHTIFFLRSPLALTPPRSSPILKRHGRIFEGFFFKSLKISGVFVSGVLLGIVWRGKGCGPRGARLCG